MTDAVKTLSDDEVAEIEARANAATGGPWGPHEMPPLSEGLHEWFEVGPYPDSSVCEVTNDYPNFRANAEFIGHAREDIPALCATVRALRQVNERLSTGLMNIHHVITNGPCERAVALGMATSAVSSLLSQNTALREQLAQLLQSQESTLDHNRSLIAELAQVTQENERLLRGDFTPEEFQNLCHNTDVQAGFDAFADGCEAYQQKVFGRCRTKGKVL